MALDLMEVKHVGAWDPPYFYAPASYLVARLCEEAGVCLHDPTSNRVEIHKATYSLDEGLLVTDKHGVTYRLHVVATRQE